jgi:hypothetical protein
LGSPAGQVGGNVIFRGWQGENQMNIAMRIPEIFSAIYWKKRRIS